MSDKDQFPPPLTGLRIVELAAIGPAPFCGMMLADQGAEVIRVDRPGEVDPLAIDGRRDVLLRNRRSLTLDLKSPAGASVLKRLAASADGLIEGFRPGVTERLGLGPDSLRALNPRLVYGRMTGWGQEGPNARLPGHDINYLAQSGTLAALGPTGQPPCPPLNLIADFGGGGMALAFGMVSALLAARQSGQGRVVDAAMTDGAAILMSGIWSLRHNGEWSDTRGQNLLDGGAPFYRCYRCADGLDIAVGAIEARFYRDLVDLLGLGADPLFTSQHEQANWPAMAETMAAIFAGQPRHHWIDHCGDREACLTAVITMDEAVDHPQSRQRGAFIESDGLIQPAPTPRYSDTPPVEPVMWRRDSARDALLAELDFDARAIAELDAAGAFGPNETV